MSNFCKESLVPRQINGPLAAPNVALLSPLMPQVSWHNQTDGELVGAMAWSEESRFS